MVTRHFLKLGFSITAFTWLAGCGTSYTVSGHAETAAFARPSCRIVVEPLRETALEVDGKSEGAYLADKEERSAASYMNDKLASERQFREKLMAKNGLAFTSGSPESTFVVRPTWNTWQPGSFFGGALFSTPARVHLSLEVIAPNGQPVDHVDVEAKSKDGYATGTRMRAALKNAGHGVSEYIAENWKCAR